MLVSGSPLTSLASSRCVSLILVDDGDLDGMSIDSHSMSIMYYHSSSSSVDMDRSRDDEEVDEVNDEMAVEANDIALSLIKDPKMARLRTYLYRDHEDKSVWTLTRAPFTTKHRDPANKPPDVLVLKEEPEKVWCQNTIEYIQWFEKGQSVSPMAFCGHAQLIWSNPKLWFVAPCLWHPDLTPQQQELAFRAKEAHRNPNIGMQKGTQREMVKEQSRCLKACKDLVNELGDEPTSQQMRERMKTTASKKISKKKKAEPSGSEQPALKRDRSAEIKAQVDEVGERSYAPKPRMKKAKVPEIDLDMLMEF
ncbi:hypothetical protein B0H15DRAFT_969065 [Mycena belliarum]|uniref:Uncharacterized protein n=1 Tax=Mycena belliarum TaxID=1033014 RepID=A0AAD6U8P4_9AGAR|nr:hypothetical protein B0H15DRAFT_969065 [Mycena belliae]